MINNDLKEAFIAESRRAIKEHTMKSKKANRGRMPSGAPNPIDVHVGNRMRLRRNLLGISQEKLASLIGLTFQQVQKYERGTNRIGASRLWDLSKTLGVSITYFYEDMDQAITANSPMHINGACAEDIMPKNTDPMQRKDTLELVTAYFRINNRKAAKHLFDAIIALSKTNGGNDE